MKPYSELVMTLEFLQKFAGLVLYDYMPPLLQAARDGNTECFKILLAAGADILGTYQV
jgi:hypothetical protein